MSCRYGMILSPFFKIIFLLLYWKHTISQLNCCMPINSSIWNEYLKRSAGPCPRSDEKPLQVAIVFYLRILETEKVISINTSDAGGSPLHQLQRLHIFCPYPGSIIWQNPTTFFPHPRESWIGSFWKLNCSPIWVLKINLIIF